MNILQRNLNRDTKRFIHKMYLKMLFAKWQPFCPGEDELMHILLKFE